MRWVLPDYIEDALPQEAAYIEMLRTRILTAFKVRGYQLVMPPMMEYLEALLTGSGQDLGLRTFHLVDQLSGKTMGVRADMTPQVARIDAHLLNRTGVSRLCYCASVLHTLPANFLATREPLQHGAEIYGHEGIEADIEMLQLLANSMQCAELPAHRIDVGHVGIFHALADDAGLDYRGRIRLFELLQNKDIPELDNFTSHMPAHIRAALLALPNLHGDASVLKVAAQHLPKTMRIDAALAQLEDLSSALADLPLSFDLSDVRGYHYHNGIVFAAYGSQSSCALAQGGRYDGIGRVFGRARAATGFSLDLRQWVRDLTKPALTGGVLAPLDTDPDLLDLIENLRSQGQVVMMALPGHAGTWREAGCDRVIQKTAAGWQPIPLIEEES